MFCKTCGQEVQEEWVVCPKCGGNLSITKKKNNDSFTDYLWLMKEAIVLLIVAGAAKYMLEEFMVIKGPKT